MSYVTRRYYYTYAVQQALSFWEDSIHYAHMTTWVWVVRFCKFVATALSNIPSYVHALGGRYVSQPRPDRPRCSSCAAAACVCTASCAP